MRWPTESSRLGLIPKAQVGDWRRFCRCQNTLFSFHDPREDSTRNRANNQPSVPLVPPGAVSIKCLRLANQKNETTEPRPLPPENCAHDASSFLLTSS